MVSKYFLPQAYADYLGFVLAINDGVKGRKITSEYKVSEVCCVVLCCVVLCLLLFSSYNPVLLHTHHCDLLPLR